MIKNLFPDENATPDENAGRFLKLLLAALLFIVLWSLLWIGLSLMGYSDMKPDSILLYMGIACGQVIFFGPMIIAPALRII